VEVGLIPRTPRVTLDIAGLLIAGLLCVAGGAIAGVVVLRDLIDDPTLATVLGIRGGVLAGLVASASTLGPPLVDIKEQLRQGSKKEGKK